MTNNAINYKKAQDDRELKERELREKERSNLVKEDIDRYNAQSQRTASKGKNAKDVVTAIDKATRMMFDGGKAVASAMNDFDWYTNFDDLEMNVLKQSIQNYAEYDEQYDNSKFVYAGSQVPLEVKLGKQSIFAYKFQPTLGNCEGYTSVTALAVRNFATSVRKDNMGQNMYDQVDLFLYPLSMDSITYTLCWIQRGLSLVNYADVRDPSTVAYGLLKAHCFNNSTLVDTFLNERAAIIDLYNQAVVKLNVLNVPIQLPYIKRHAFLASNIFVQGENVGKSYFIMNPNSYFVFDEVNGALQCRDFEARISIGTVARMREIIDEMIIPLINSQTIGIMSGDIDRAFGESHPFVKINQSAMDQLYPILNDDPKYLMSIKNADIVPINPSVSTFELNDFDIKQGVDNYNNPFLYQGTQGSGIPIRKLTYYVWDSVDHDSVENQVYERHNVIVDYYDSNKITEEDQCYNTSFKIVRNESFITHCRSEILVQEKYYTYSPSTRNITQTYARTSNVMEFEHSTGDTYDVDTIKETFEQILLFSQFKFVPKIIVLWWSQTDAKTTVWLAWNRNKNRNFISEENLSKIQDTTLLSMFEYKLTKSDSASRNRRRK
jgi:hypothetical protein